MLHTEGRLVAGDDQLAVTLFQKAADQGLPEAAYMLGVMYASGRGVAQDQAQAVAWCRRAAGQGHAEAQFTLGLMCAKGDGMPRDGWQAVSWCRKAAALGHSEAQYTLAVMYARGDGVVQDAAQSVKWYRQAAEQGHAKAQFDLAEAYAAGDGVDRDDGLAAVWYRRAAEQGHDAAQLALGRFFVDGRGVPQDQVQAVGWFERAAARGNADAQSELDVLTPARDDVPAAAEPSHREAPDAEAPVVKRAWPPVPATAPETDVVHVPDDTGTETWQTADALAELRREADGGDALAQYRLAGICATGDGVPQDMPAALRWCRKAAEQGLAEAEYNLGLIHAQEPGRPGRSGRSRLVVPASGRPRAPRRAVRDGRAVRDRQRRSPRRP